MIAETKATKAAGCQHICARVLGHPSVLDCVLVASFVAGTTPEVLELPNE